MNINKKHYKLAFDIGLFAIIILGLFFIRKNIMDVINPFLYALVLAYILNPLVNWIEKKGLKRSVAILLVFLSILLIVSILFISFIPKLVSDISVLISDIPNIFEFIENTVNSIKTGDIFISFQKYYDFFNIDSQLDQISTSIKQALTRFLSILISSTSGLLDIVMTPIITFYYLKDKDKFVKLIMEAVPEKFREKLKEITGEIDKVLGGFIRGQLIVAGFVGFLTGLGCKILGVPYALTIGLVAGLTNIIPYFGPWIGGIMPVILSLMNSPMTTIWVIVLIIIVQQIESTFLSPQIMSHSVGLHPLSVIFSVLLFGNIFGIFGMILGVPITGTIKVLIKYIYQFKLYLNEKLS